MQINGIKLEKVAFEREAHITDRKWKSGLQVNEIQINTRQIQVNEIQINDIQINTSQIQVNGISD